MHNLHLLCPTCHKDSENISGSEYVRWIHERNFIDALVSDGVRSGRGFNASGLLGNKL